MTDLSKTNQDLTIEIAVLKERIRELEVAETESKRAQESLRESEEKYRSLFNQSTEGIYLHDLEGRILDVNEKACVQSGYSREEWRGLTVFDGHLANTPKAEILQAWSQWAPGQRFVVETEHQRKDGTVYPVEISTGIVLYGDTKVMLAIVTDITERKQAEEALIISEARFRAIIDVSPVPMALNDEQQHITFLNPAFVQTFGYTQEDIPSLAHWWPNAYPDLAYRQWVADTWQDELERAKRTETAFSPMELTVRCKNGTSKTVMASAASLSKSFGGNHLVVLYDITIRKQAEALLLESELFLKESQRIARLGGWKANPHTDYLEWTEGVYDIIGAPLGYKPCLSEGLRVFLPEYIPSIREKVTDCMITGEPFTLECEATSTNGKHLWTEVRGLAPIIAGERSYVIGTFQDITERKQVEATLRESEERYRTLVENASDIVFRTDNSGHFTFVNPAGIHITGYEEKELIGRHYPTLIRPDMRDEAIKFFGRQFVKGINNTYSEYPILTKDGHDVWLGQNTQLIVEDGHVTGFQAVSRDITDRKRAEEMLRRSEEKFRFLTENMNDNIFTMNLNLQTTYVSQSIEKILGFTPEERMKQDITEQVTPTSMTQIEKILSEELEREEKGLGDPNRSIKFEVEYYHKGGSTVWMENVISGIRDDQGVAVGIHGVSRDITERKKSEHALKESFERLHKSLGATVQAMAVTVETRDPYTAGHQRRVADLARSIATEMNLPTHQIEGIRMASTIHDLGKISVPAEILSKPKKLTNIEFELIKSHAQSGYDILKDIDFPWPVARMVLEHHEKIDGSGYPNGLVGENILLESKILAVADVVEAMASHRPYRPSLGIDAAFKELEENKGTQYDAAAVEACLSLFREKGYQFVRA